MATKKKENNENTKVSGKKAEASAVNNAEAEAAREKFQEKLKELSNENGFCHKRVASLLCAATALKQNMSDEPEPVEI